MPFSSKVFRNLRDSIVGVKEQEEDPLKATRLSIEAYSKDAKALHQTLESFAKTNDELDGIRGDIVKTAKAFLLPVDQQGGLQIDSDPELTKVGTLFSSEIDAICHSKTDTRKLLDDAISEASGMERRLTDLTTSFTERDKAAELMEHYKTKMQALNEEHISKPKKDMDDRIKRNLVKQQNAVEAYKRVDNEVRGQANEILESRQADFASILEKMCTYIATNSKVQAGAIPAFEKQIPEMIQVSKEKSEKARVAREAAKGSKSPKETTPTTSATTKDESPDVTPTKASADEEPNSTEAKKE